MGIASGIFWIMVGLLYILYQAYKEHPDDTIAGILVCIVVVGGIIGFTLLYNWLTEQNIFLGAAFGIGGVAFIVVAAIRINIKDTKERQARFAEYRARKAKIEASLTEEDYVRAARAGQYRIGLSLNPDDQNYWKNEPYFSKVKENAILSKSIQMRKAERESKISEGSENASGQ